MSQVQSNKARIAKFLRDQYNAERDGDFYRWVHRLALAKQELFHEEARFFVLHDRTRRLIRPDGEVVLLEAPQTMGQLEKLLDTDTVDNVNLRHMGFPLMVMVLPDRGYETKEVDLGEQETAWGKAHVTERRPTRALLADNPIATLLYHANCVPGTTHRIVGPVAIVPDADFGGVL